MTLPKKLSICGKDVTIAYDPRRSDGEYGLGTRHMVIGTANKADILETLLHECLEAILFERGHRYIHYTEGNDGIRFVMDHHEFENVVKDVVQLFKQLRALPQSKSS